MGARHVRDLPWDGAGVTTNDADLILHVLREVKADVCEMKADLGEVKADVKITNGRLRKLELWRHGLEVVERAHRWVRPAVISFLTGAGIACLAWFLSTL